MSKFGQITPSPHLERFQFHQSSLGQEFLATMTLSVVLVLIRFAAVIRLDSHLLGGAEHDAGLYYWLVRSNALMIKGWASDRLWFDTAAFYPYGRTLAWSDNFLLPSLIFTMLRECGLSEVLSYNLLIVLAGFLNGYCSYRLAYRVTGDVRASLFGGVAFLSAAPFTAHLGHPQLQFAFWIPLGVSTFLSFLSLPTLKKAIVLGLILSACFLTTVYYAVFIALAYVALWLAFGFQRPILFSLTHIWRFVVGLFIGLTPLLPVIPSYLAVQKVFGARHLYEASAFAADLFSLFSAPASSLLYSTTSGWSHNEAWLFSGAILTTLALLALRGLGNFRSIYIPVTFFLGFIICSIYPEGAQVGAILSWLLLGSIFLTLLLIGRRRRAVGPDLFSSDDIIAAFAALAAFAVIFAFGPLRDSGSDFWGVYEFLFKAVPSVSAIRAIGRSGFVLILCLAILSSLTLQKWPRNRSIFLVPILTILLIVENYCLQYPIEMPRRASAVFDQLDRSASPEDVVVVLPFSGALDQDGRVKSWTEFSKIHSNAMNWSVGRKVSLLNGYSGQRSWITDNFPRWLESFPEQNGSWERALGQIAGLRYVIYISKFAPSFDRAAFLAETSKVNALRLILDDEEGNFLFAFEKEIPLDPKYQLLVPSNRNNVAYLHYELRSQESTLGLIEVNLHHDSIENPPFSSVTLEADREWRTFSTPLAVQSESVRPQKIYFSVKNADVLMRFPRFQLYR